MRHQKGFTIVELLIVIVVISILAVITIIAFNGVQQRARDAQRRSDVSSIIKALEQYYVINGKYPAGSGSTTINSGWSTTADLSWQNLVNVLAPYATIPIKDPTSSPGSSVLSSTSSFNYAYFSDYNGSYCGAGASQTFLLVYRLESTTQEDKLIGSCVSPPVGPYSNASNYRISK